MKNVESIQRIIIVGGGTAGWMTAAALCKVYEDKSLEITLVESDQIATVGVGEATIPHIRYFNERLGIDEHEFMLATKATYKLGVELSNWGALGDRYFHPFGEFGFNTDGVSFYHYWLRARLAGYEAAIDEFSLAAVMAKAGKFAYPSAKRGSLRSTYSYAFHLDATLYARYLRSYCEDNRKCEDKIKHEGKENLKNRFRRIEGKVVRVQQNPESGDIDALHLESGEILAADFFIDCTGFRALLLNKTLDVGYEDWSHWLPCDRAVAVATASTEAPAPYTKVNAQQWGWQWTVPLQHRIGNGMVYCSDYVSDDEAAMSLQSNLSHNKLSQNTLGDLNFIQFKAGARSRSWHKNCVAIGLSSGFLEPLESTSIYLIQMAIMTLTDLLPANKNYAAERAEFNSRISLEYERLRDYLILHYHATDREDTEFWARCKNMTIPESLALKLNAFQQSGHILRYGQGLFREPSWAALYLGQGVLPDTFHPAVGGMSDRELKEQLDLFKAEIAAAAAKMPQHRKAIEAYCSNDSSHKSPKAAGFYGANI